MACPDRHQPSGLGQPRNGGLDSRAWGYGDRWQAVGQNVKPVLCACAWCVAQWYVKACEGMQCHGLGCKQKKHDSWCITKETWSCVCCNSACSKATFNFHNLQNQGRNAKDLPGIPQISVNKESVHVEWKSRMLERFETRHVRWLESQSLSDLRASKQIITKSLRKEKGRTLPCKLALAVRGPLT